MSYDISENERAMSRLDYEFQKQDAAERLKIQVEIAQSALKGLFMAWQMQRRSFGLDGDSYEVDLNHSMKIGNLYLIFGVFLAVCSLVLFSCGALISLDAIT